MQPAMTIGQVMPSSSFSATRESVVSMPSSTALMRNEHVLTMMTSALSGSSMTSSWVSASMSALMRSLSTSFLAQPSVMKATFLVVLVCICCMAFRRLLAIVGELEGLAVVLLAQEGDDGLKGVLAR